MSGGAAGSVCCRCRGFGPVIPSHAKRKLCDWKKKKCFTPLWWWDLLSKCWSALTCSWSAVQSWNSTLEWGLKKQLKDKEMGPAHRLISPSAPDTSGLNEICMHILSTRSPSLHWMMLFTYAFRRNSSNGKEIDSWLMLTAERMCICICAFANIFSCLVNLRPV